MEVGHTSNAYTRNCRQKIAAYVTVYMYMYVGAPHTVDGDKLNFHQMYTIGKTTALIKLNVTNTTKGSKLLMTSYTVYTVCALQ